ncbi:MAG: 3-keto-5-aminohexanoate cleavage protein [Trebonia sp.]
MHARGPETGRPTSSAAVFEQFIPELQTSGAVINITTGGAWRSSAHRLP